MVNVLGNLWGADHRYSLKVEFTGDSYQSHWNNDMHRMFAYARQIQKHRSDMLSFKVLRDDGKVMQSQ